MTALFYFTMTLFILVCAILILLILIQKGRGGGLASAFGGAGGQTAFGSKTGDVLTWATSIVFAVFVVLAVCLNLIANHINNKPGTGAVIPVAANMPTVPSTPETAPPPPANALAGPTAQAPAPPMNPAAAPPTTMPAASEQIPVTTMPTSLP